MKKISIGIFIIALLILDFILRLSDIKFNSSELLIKSSFESQLQLASHNSKVDFRTDIFPEYKAEKSTKTERETGQLTADTINFDGKTLKLLAISHKNKSQYATFKASMVNPTEGFGHYYHASEGDDVLGAKLIKIINNQIELQVKDNRFTLKLFNLGENNAVN